MRRTGQVRRRMTFDAIPIQTNCCGCAVFRRCPLTDDPTHASLSPEGGLRDSTRSPVRSASFKSPAAAAFPAEAESPPLSSMARSSSGLTFGDARRVKEARRVSVDYITLERRAEFSLLAARSVQCWSTRWFAGGRLLARLFSSV